MDLRAERSGALGIGKIKVLIIDDVAIDAELSVMALRRARISTECVFVSDEPELRAALPNFAPDVVLCDFGFPNFSGLAAQKIVQGVYPETPLIFVSGTISEDRAVLALESGAVDYVLKSNLTRLPSAVERAVRHAREQKSLELELEKRDVSLRDTEFRSRHHAERLETLWRLVNDRAATGENLVLSILHAGAKGIRPGATLSRCSRSHRCR